MAGRSASFTIAAASCLLALLLATPALAQLQVRLETERAGAVTRIQLIYPEAAGGELSAQADIVGGAVLVATVSQAMELDPRPLASAAPALIAGARLDADGLTLRLALNQTVEPRISVSHNIIAIDLAAPGVPPLPDIVSPYEAAERTRRAAEAAARAAAERAAAQEPPALPLAIRSGEASEYTRIEFTWPEPVTYVLSQDGRVARLAFSRRADVDLSVLTATPPRMIDSITREEGPTGFGLSFNLAPGAEARAWEDGNRIVFDVVDPRRGSPTAMLAALTEYADAQAEQADGGETLQPSTEAPETGDLSVEPPFLEETVDVAAAEQAVPGVMEEPAQLVETQTLNAVPEGGVVAVDVRNTANAVSLSFEWAHLPGAAVFRRGESVWIVFDAAAEIDLSSMIGSNVDYILGYRAWRGEDYSAVQVDVASSTQADVSAAGDSWTVVFAGVLAEPPSPIRLVRNTRPNQPGRIDIALDTARSVRRVEDPLVRDFLYVITADGERRGVISERRFVEAVVLPSSQGVAIQPLADDLAVVRVPGGARVGRPGGLALSRAGDPAMTQTRAQPVSPAFIDFAGWRGNRSYNETRRELERRAATFEPEPLLALARFNLGWGLAPEALGSLDLAVLAQPQLANTPEVKAMRGAASFMMFRFEDARRYFTDPQLNSDPASQPWLGMIAVENANWDEARRRFAAGAEAEFFMEPVWRARMHAAHARAAIEANDLSATRQLLDAAGGDEPDLQASSELAYVEARLLAANGETARAIDLFDRLGRSPWEPIQARALLEKIRLDLQTGAIAASDGVEELEALRYRWRGDRTEIEVARLLGDFYARAGRYNEALAVLETARNRNPESLLARRIGDDMDALFRRLFLEQEADRMAPLDALALWYEYNFLTPQGEEGQRLVRRIADRLIEVDLLAPAAELLAHQVYELTSIPSYARAQIASDLAVVYLMAGREQDALEAINSTRVAGLPTEVVQERRLLEARAWSGLGQQDRALELISGDRGPQADRLRADITWAQRDWPNAGRRLEALLGERWREATPLEPGEAHDVLRAAIAWSLAGDPISVERVESRYGPVMAGTRFASAFSVVTSEVDGAGDTRLIDLVTNLASVEGIDSFMDGFARRFDAPAPAS